jgi:MFS superfamily sulfate permease-like transporter/nucleotide-binding universal stress UspA family protein
MNAIIERFRLFNTFLDSRWEDFTKDTWIKTTYRDFSAGLIVALTAIPMAMGFAMAMGLRPEQGIIAGALACAVGRTWGGSKYQVYGPTAAFIPVIAGLISKYGEAGGGTLQEAHGFLVLVSIIAGITLMIMGLFGLGKYIKRAVPNSIVVGFTVGIAVAIALTNIEDILGLEDFKDLLGEDEDIKGGLWHNIQAAYSNFDKINAWSLTLGLMTFFLTKLLLRISIYIPAPLISIGVATFLAATAFAGKGVILVKDIYGSIPNNFFVFTPPIMPALTGGVVMDILYFVAAIVFVSGVESLLCSSMADRLADNRKTPFDPDKELWGQGLVQILIPLVNGFPCTGALARTATSIKAGAVTPLAGYFKAILKLTLAYYIASYLEMVPMACIGGILLWVASNMIKPAEIREVLEHNKFHSALMIFTAIMVPITDFLTGVLSALVIYGLLYRFFDKSSTHAVTPEVRSEAGSVMRIAGEFNKVIVPIACQETDRDILRYAARQASLGIGGEYHFVHILDDNAADVGQAQIRQMENKMRDFVDPFFSPLASKPKLNYKAIVSTHILDSLLEQIVQEQANLVMLGHHKPLATHRALGSHLAMLAPCSVWVVPDDSSEEIRNIIAPIDFSTPSKESVANAVGIAQRTGSDVYALHVYFDESSIRYEEHVEKIRHNEGAALENFLSLIEKDGVRIEGVFAESSKPANEIIRQAKERESNLIVIGTRGRSKAASILLGSVASQVLAEAEIPVLAIHHGTGLGLKEALLSNLGRRDHKTN